MMPANHEVERLIRVYGDYRENERVQTQWREDNPGNQAIVRERQRWVRRLLDTHGDRDLSDSEVLDIGCGSGKVLAQLVCLGTRPENLHGVDLLPDRIAEAKQQQPDMHFQCDNAEHLHFSDSSFDLALLFTVFSSILDEAMACNVAREVTRVLRIGGAILWYDFRYHNPRNPHVRGITREQISALFPHFNIHLRTLTVLPPLARRLGGLTPVLYPVLAAIPFLRTHYLGMLTRMK